MRDKLHAQLAVIENIHKHARALGNRLAIEARPGKYCTSFFVFVPCFEKRYFIGYVEDARALRVAKAILAEVRALRAEPLCLPISVQMPKRKPVTQMRFRPSGVRRTADWLDERALEMEKSA